VQVYEPENITSYNKVSITIIKYNPQIEGYFVVFISEAHKKHTDRSCSCLSKKKNIYILSPYNNIRQDTCKITYRLTWFPNYTYLLDFVRNSSQDKTCWPGAVVQSGFETVAKPLLGGFLLVQKIKVINYFFQVPW